MGSVAFWFNAEIGRTSEGLHSENPRVKGTELLGPSGKAQTSVNTKKIREIRMYIHLENSGKYCPELRSELESR